MLDDGVSIAGTRGLFSASLERSPCLFAPGRLTRAAARVRRLELDRQLARGADPSRSGLLAARAAQLTCSDTRRRLARALERFASTDARGLPPLAVVPRLGAIAHNRDEILGLADRLRRSGILYVRGIAMLELVLIDGAGPAYTDPRGEGLARQLELAAEALAG